MDSIVLSLLGPAVMWALDRAREAPAQSESELPPEGPVFTADQAATFTRSDAQGVRTFERHVTDGLSAQLAARSVVPVDGGPLCRMGSVWRVIPLRENALGASTLVQNARAGGAVLLGSLTLLYLASGRDVPMLLVVGGPGSEALAGPGGHFAILADKPLPVTVKAPAEKPGDVARAALKEQKKNGAAKATVEYEVVATEVLPSEGST